MISYRVIYSSKARKFLNKNRRQGLLFHQAFEAIAQNKSNVNLYDMVRYQHATLNDVFRLRLGKYRAIFRIQDDKLIILVLMIAS